MKKIIIAAIIVILIGIGLLIFFMNKNGKVKYTTAPVQIGSIRATVTATGTVNAVKTVSVGTQVSGTLKELHVDYNSRVKKGQVIAEIDPAMLQAQVDKAKADMLAAKANVEKAKAALEDSKRTWERNQQLFSKNLIARSDLDTSETAFLSNKAQVSAAQAQVAQTEASLRYAQTNLGYTRIVSPVDGIVVSRNVDVGQTVAASFQTPTLFSIAQDLTKMQIETSIDEADIGRIEAGQEVEFTVDAYPDNTFHGTVDEVRIAPVTVSNVVTYVVIVKVDNGDLRLKPGMTANVSIIVANRDRVLKIPNAALRFKPPVKDDPAARTQNVNKPGTDISGSTNGQSVRAVTTNKGEEQSALEKGKRNALASGPPDKTGRGLSDSEKPRRRFSATADKEGVRPPRFSEKGIDSEKDGAQPASQAGRKTAQAVPRQYAIWILENDKPKRVMITVGISDGSFTEITSGNIKEGQAVITGSAVNGGNKSNNTRLPGPPRMF